MAFRTQFKTISANKQKTMNDTTQLTEDELLQGCHLGLDSHADMTCIGRHAHILETYHGKICDVFPFNNSYEPIKIYTLSMQHLLMILTMVKPISLKLTNV